MTTISGDVELIEKVKASFKLKTDVEIAEKIGSTKQNLSQIRAGKRKLSNREKLNCYDKLGYAWARDAILALFQ